MGKWTKTAAGRLVRLLLGELVGHLLDDRTGQGRSGHRHVFLRRRVQQVESLTVAGDNGVYGCNEAIDVHSKGLGRGTGLEFSTRRLTEERTEVLFVCGEVPTRLLLHLLVVGQATDGVVDEEANVLTPLLEKGVARLGSVERLDRRSEILRVLIESTGRRP